jgi:L-seryl-tRNA(Ser) seleniumtransferase
MPMGIYEHLGVVPVINAAGTLTKFGGSLMLPEVIEAMVDASQSFVDLAELHLAAGRRIADVIGVEAAHVCNGAAAGIALMAAACMAGSDLERIKRLPDTAGMRNRFVVQNTNRNSYDEALRLAGGEFLEIEADSGALAQALGERVAAVYLTIAWSNTGKSVPLPEMARIAHQAAIPVIVDAAAEVPPVENLARFVNEGADLVVFSGGKGMRGPQSSGVILGRRDLIEACRLNDNPNRAVGRQMKAGKEEIAGLVRAVELYVAKDHSAEMAQWEERVHYLLDQISRLPVRAWRQMPFGIGQLVPHLAVTWDEQALGVTLQQVVDGLLQGRPRIALQLVDPERDRRARPGSGQLRIHPHTLRDGEEVIVARRLVELLGRA